MASPVPRAVQNSLRSNEFQATDRFVRLRIDDYHIEITFAFVYGHLKATGQSACRQISEERCADTSCRFSRSS
jgi:hypothetical protein